MLLQTATDAEPGGNGMVCYASKDTRNDQIIAIGKTDKASLRANGLRKIACPAEMDWSEEDARAQCAFYKHYDFVTKAYFFELHGVTTEEVCNEGREAAGLLPLQAQ